MIDSVGNVVNEPAFKASLRVETAIKDSARLKGIKKAFAEKTADMRGSLSISSNIAEYDNKECFYLGKDYENSIAAFFEDSFDTMMGNLNDNELITKLVKIAKSLRVLNKRYAHYDKHHLERYRLQNEQKRNLLIAEDCRQQGDEVMANRFDLLAKMFGKKLTKLDNAQEDVDVKTYQAIERLANGDKDIIQMKDLIF